MLGAIQHRPSVWLFTFVLAVILPLVDAFVFDRVKSTIRLYLWNIIAEWVVCMVGVFIIFHNGLFPADFGQNLGTYPRTFIVSAILFVLVAAFLLINKSHKPKTSRSPESTQRIVKAVGKLRKLAPKTETERNTWFAVALTAGLCEEFLYRGWLLNLTGSALKSVWLGLLISSLFFGLGHLYQGPGGMIKSGLVGLVLGLIYIASGSLLPGQILHTLIDLNNGLAIGKILSRAETSPAA